MRKVIGYEESVCGHCQGTGKTRRQVWGYPPGTRSILLEDVPYKFRRAVSEVWKHFYDKYNMWDRFTCAFRRRAMGRHPGWATKLGPCVKAAYTMASWRAAEEHGWTPDVERAFEQKFAWFREVKAMYK